MAAPKLSPKTTEAISKLLVAHPFYAVLIMQLLRVSESTAVPTAGTDSVNLFVNPTWFGKLTIDERVFVLAHEVLHVVYQHPQRTKAWMDRGIGPDLKQFNPKKMNVAQDYVINDTLVKGGMKSMPVGGMLNPQFTYEDLADDVYCKLPDDEANKDDGNFDHHMAPAEGNEPGKEAGPSEADIARALKSAEVTAKAQGKMPATAQRVVDQYCEPQVSWRDEIRMGVTQIAGKDAATWVRPNRKRMALPPHIYMPGTADHRAGTIALYGDTSGSVSNQEWKHFFGEMAAIVEELNPEACFIGSCDAYATDPERVTSPEDVLSYVPVGGGGTDMTAIFDALERNEVCPDVLVILTDGYTPFGEQPGYEVIWVITSDVKAPYGKSIKINVEH